MLRHGQSEWNRANRFTGWVDVNLTEQGIAEAEHAGEILRTEGALPDVAHTSLLKRAIITTNLALTSIDRLWIPQHRTWRLNERHYGALAGLDKTEILQQHGEEQLLLWRRSYAVQPPALEDNSAFRKDPRYRDLTDSEVPHTESLADVERRLVPYWREHILPQLESGATVLLGAHGNSLRALVKHLEGITDEEIAHFEIGTGKPRIYDFAAGRTHLLTA